MLNEMIYARPLNECVKDGGTTLMFWKDLFKEDVDFISELVNVVNTTQADVSNIYDKMTSVEIPKLEIRRENDSCFAVTRTVTEKALCFMTAEGDSEDTPWADSESIFKNTESSIASVPSMSVSKTLGRASHKSQRKQKEAAEVVATPEVIKIMTTQHQYEEEIRELEAAVKRSMAEREAEERKLSLNKPLHAQAIVPQVDVATTFYGSSNDLVKILAEAIIANWIPIPEPVVFFGEPLQYTDCSSRG